MLNWVLTPQAAGVAIVAGILIPLVGTGLVAARGNLVGLEAAFRGVAGIGGKAESLAVVTLWGIAGSILQIAGFGILAQLLQAEPEKTLWLASITLVALGLTLGLVEGTFQASVTVWAAAEHEIAGEVDGIYEPLRIWLNLWLQRVWVPLVLLGVIGFASASAATGLVPGWVGGTTAAVAVLVLLNLVVQGEIIVALAFIPPLILGTALIASG